MTGRLEIQVAGFYVRRRIFAHSEKNNFLLHLIFLCHGPQLVQISSITDDEPFEAKSPFFQLRRNLHRNIISFFFRSSSHRQKFQLSCVLRIAKRLLTPSLHLFDVNEIQQNLCPVREFRKTGNDLFSDRLGNTVNFIILRNKVPGPEQPPEIFSVEPDRFFPRIRLSGSECGCERTESEKVENKIVLFCFRLHTLQNPFIQFSIPFLSIHDAHQKYAHSSGIERPFCRCLPFSHNPFQSRMRFFVPDHLAHFHFLRNPLQQNASFFDQKKRYIFFFLHQFLQQRCHGNFRSAHVHGTSQHQYFTHCLPLICFFLCSNASRHLPHAQDDADPPAEADGNRRTGCEDTSHIPPGH